MENCGDFSFTPMSKEEYYDRYWIVKECTHEFYIRIYGYEYSGKWPILEFFEAFKEVSFSKNNETTLSQHICHLAFSHKS